METNKNKNLENVDITNNCIIDLKLKLSKVDYFLTTILDFNNTLNLKSDKPVRLISPANHSTIADTLINLSTLLLNECNKLIKEVHNESTDKQENKTSGL